MNEKNVTFSIALGSLFIYPFDSKSEQIEVGIDP